MKTSTSRILTTHVGSIPRPESLTTLLRDRLGGQVIDEARLAVCTDEAVAEVVRRQAETGLDVIAGADCGFAQGALYQRQHPTVMWAKFEALVEGAKLATNRLWGR